MDETEVSNFGHLVLHPATVSITAFVWLVSWAVLTAFLYQSPYDVIHKNKANALRIGLRLAMIVVPVHVLAFLSPPYSTVALVGVLVWVLVWLGPESLVVGFGHVIAWVMGWPSRDMAAPRWNPFFPRRNSDGIDKAIARSMEFQTAEPHADWSAVVGREGKALSRLSPSGKVRINGATYPARSRGAFITRGTPVRVIETDGFGLIVDESESAK